MVVGAGVAEVWAVAVGALVGATGVLAVAVAEGAVE